MSGNKGQEKELDTDSDSGRGRQLESTQSDRDSSTSSTATTYIPDSEILDRDRAPTPTQKTSIDAIAVRRFLEAWIDHGNFEGSSIEEAQNALSDPLFDPEELHNALMYAKAKLQYVCEEYKEVTGDDVSYANFVDLGGKDDSTTNVIPFVEANDANSKLHTYDKRLKRSIAAYCKARKNAERALMESNTHVGDPDEQAVRQARYYELTAWIVNKKRLDVVSQTYLSAPEKSKRGPLFLYNPKFTEQNLKDAARQLKRAAKGWLRHYDQCQKRIERVYPDQGSTLKPLCAVRPPDHDKIINITGLASSEIVRLDLRGTKGHEFRRALAVFARDLQMFWSEYLKVMSVHNELFV